MSLKSERAEEPVDLVELARECGGFEDGLGCWGLVVVGRCVWLRKTVAMGLVVVMHFFEDLRVGGCGWNGTGGESGPFRRR